jgi:hypothetical protein
MKRNNESNGEIIMKVVSANERKYQPKNGNESVMKIMWRNNGGENEMA